MQLTTTSSTTQTTSLTLEHLLYGLILLGAAVLRLGLLGQPPLSPAEASEALAVWQFWQPATAVALLNPHLPLSPAYFSLTSFLTQLAGESEAVLRLVPALAGLALVGSPWLLRPYLGRTAALVLAFLLAVSPTHTSLARTVGGDSLALLAGMGLLICWWQWRMGGGVRWVVVGAAVGGFGLSSSPLFYNLLLTLGLVFGLERRLGPHLNAPQPAPLTPAERRTALLTGGATAVLVSTFALLNLEGLGRTANIAALWLGQWGASGGLNVWLEPVLILGRYEGLALVLGLMAAVWATWGDRPAPAFFAYWYILALLVMLLQPTYAPNVALLALPAFGLVALWVQALFAADFDQQVEEPWVRWPLAGTLAILALVLLANLGRHARLLQFGTADNAYFSLALICLLMAAILLAVVLVWDWRAALQGAVLPALLLGGVLSMGQAWRLGVLAANDPRERWVAEATDDELPHMVALLSQIGRHTKRAATDLTIFSTVDAPAVRWYLRELPVVYGQTVPPAAVYDMVLTPLGVEPALGERYTGSDWGYGRPPLEHVLAPSEAMRWWFFRQTPQPVLEARLILWVRADLVLP